MKFQPKTEKEIAEANLWPAGEYSFEVVSAIDKTSKSGNEMIELKLKIYNDDGGFIFLNDYLLESLPHKLRHAACGCGLLDQYQAGSLVASDFAGRVGKLKLKIQKDKNGQYPDRNAVADYLVEDNEPAAASAPAAAPKSTADELADFIPF